MKQLFIIISFFISFNCNAQTIDKIAHFGISWAINHIGYEVCHKMTDEKIPCLVGSAIIATTVGALKELHDGNKNSTSEHLKDMSANGLGILGSSIVIGINF